MPRNNDVRETVSETETKTETKTETEAGVTSLEAVGEKRGDTSYPRMLCIWFAASLHPSCSTSTYAPTCMHRTVYFSTTTVSTLTRHLTQDRASNTETRDRIRGDKNCAHQTIVSKIKKSTLCGDVIAFNCDIRKEELKSY